MIVNTQSTKNIIKNKTKFLASDGEHSATIENELVSLNMQPVNEIEQLDENIFFLCILVVFLHLHISNQ